MKQSLQQSAIVWPEEYLPGTTDNFASNEIIVSGLTAAQRRSSMTPRCGRAITVTLPISISMTAAARPQRQRPLQLQHLRLPIEAQITEYVPPVAGQAARVAGTVGRRGCNNAS